MGILGTIASAIFSKSEDGTATEHQHGFLSGICELINNPNIGGLSGLVDKFKEGGMGAVVHAWVSTGPNPPITADQLKNVLSNEQIRDFATKMGIDPDTAAQHLADLLPTVVDHLTPDGKLPAGGFDCSTALAQLKKSLFGS